MYMDCPDQAEFGIRGLAHTQNDPDTVHTKLSPTGYIECESQKEKVKFVDADAILDGEAADRLEESILLKCSALNDI